MKHVLAFNIGAGKYMISSTPILLCLECRRVTPAGTARAEDPATSEGSEAAEAVPAESKCRNGKQTHSIVLPLLL